ncbi:LmeA family phospholipid-binding protein [Phormidium sp. CCY1219]|uniref:LmeA family phospholipid-binding protein n=1 Tax=Phormidium sp. CCY1219 TaxID=2886104 RepID=UPI002D1F04C0|nr:DUF2993 domain-containing protein [Phormidium sp. CCY1219]MEB3827715.1 DUF2993 domain-containing protein [Phormidium sp. CCY1219]
MKNTNNKMHEKAVSKAAEMGLASSLTEVEDLNVEVQCDPGKIVSGQVETVEILGEGLVMKQDLRMEKMEVETEAISINAMRAAIGNIELEEPTAAQLRVILTERDITRAFASDYIHQKLQKLRVTIDGEPKTLDIQKVDFTLPGKGKIHLSCNVWVRETGESKPVAFTAVPQVRSNNHGATLTDISYGDKRELSPELTAALVEKSDDILNLRTFELSGISLQLENLEVKKGQIKLQAQAYIEEIPTA